MITIGCRQKMLVGKNTKPSNFSSRPMEKKNVCFFLRLVQTNPLTAFADFQDKKSDRRYRVRVAVQVLAKPGSYVTSPASTTTTAAAAAAASPTVSSSSSSSSSSSPYVTNSSTSSSALRAPSGPNVGDVESGLSNNELEWRTKEHGGLLLRGLLIKLEHC